MFVRERDRPEPIEKLMPVPAALYQKAEWRSLAVPHVASDDSVHGWEGDPALWDKALADLPIQFARRDPKRYTVSQPHAEVH